MKLLNKADYLPDSNSSKSDLPQCLCLMSQLLLVQLILHFDKYFVKINEALSLHTLLLYSVGKGLASGKANSNSNSGSGLLEKRQAKTDAEHMHCVDRGG